MELHLRSPTRHNDVVAKLSIGTAVHSQVHSLKKICRSEYSEEKNRRKEILGSGRQECTWIRKELRKYLVEKYLYVAEYLFKSQPIYSLPCTHELNFSKSCPAFRFPGQKFVRIYCLCQSRFIPLPSLLH